MILIPQFSTLLALLLVGAFFSAQAQPSTTAQASYLTPSATAPPDPSFQRASFAAAYDSLMHRVVGIRTKAESRMGVFKTSQGTLGGLHRKVLTYAGKSVVYENGNTTLAGLVKRQIIKHRYGIELEKVMYYDAQHRKVLSERYENHQLTRLELLEYRQSLYSPTATWLFVPGDYMAHRFELLSPSGKRTKQISYFFRPAR